MNKRLFITVVCVLSMMTFSMPPVALAAPLNDNFADAETISLPFTGTVDNTDATMELDEPQPCGSSPRTVWYKLTPGTNALVRADMNNSSFFDTMLAVYVSNGSGFGGLSFQGCATFGGSITFNVEAGATYYIQAGDNFTGGGSLHLNLEEIPPPANDNFAGATPITGLPFEDSDPVDVTGATTEAGEPSPTCRGSTPPPKTIWYAFTPTASGSVTARLFNLTYSPVLAAYTGNSLTSLTEVGCRAFSSLLTVHVDTGITTYFQVGSFHGDGGQVQFHLEVTPPPIAAFGFDPGDPSVFDTVHFSDQSFDPGDVGFQSRVWDFGDGTTFTSPECCADHRYAADGEYTVHLTVTTFDGRSDSDSRVVQVRTHDVAITKFSAPQSASAGQTRTISVGIRNTCYPETVEVQLFKSVPGGFQFIGSTIQSVPVRSGNRTTGFRLNYTFTSDDAAIGKVTFKAAAFILNARDALPADNEAIASPTKVSR